jgi:hypothetical protein
VNLLKKFTSQINKYINGKDSSELIPVNTIVSQDLTTISDSVINIRKENFFKLYFTKLSDKFNHLNENQRFAIAALIITFTTMLGFANLGLTRKVDAQNIISNQEKLKPLGNKFSVIKNSTEAIFGPSKYVVYGYLP